MTEKKVVLTYDGLKNMEAELENLKTVRRKDVAEKIKEARGQGDLSEKMATVQWSGTWSSPATGP